MESDVIQAGQEIEGDRKLIALWLHGKAQETQVAYLRYAERFLADVGKPLPLIALADVQRFAVALADQGLAVSSQGTILSVVKSLLSFAHELGYCAFNVGAALKIPRHKDTLNERIMSEADVLIMIRSEPNQRDRLMLLLLYATGMRVGELCKLCWRDCKAVGDEGLITIYGKGSKTNVIRLNNPAIWSELQRFRGDAADHAPVFASRKKGGHLTRQRAWAIVRAAAERVAIASQVSPHWLRHAHASHAMDRGAPLHLVQRNLGHANPATTGRYLHARPTDSSTRFLPL